MLRNFLWIGVTIMALVFVFALPTSSDHGLPTHVVLPGKKLPSPEVSSMPSNPPSSSAALP